MGFSLQFYPWMLTFGSLALAIIATVMLVAAFSYRCLARLPQSCVLHVATVLSLLPVGYLLLRVVVMFLDKK